MTPSEIKRLYHIVKVQLEYGLDELMPTHQLTKAPLLARRSLFWMKNQHPDKQLGERLRLALQELGPVWIKFGQMMSTRRDLFPPHIADQLALLQDQVSPFDGELAKTQMEKALGVQLKTGLMILTLSHWHRHPSRRFILPSSKRQGRRWYSR
ncbi:ubiquinone biosynthesis monooxygenase UbiB [Vibrio maritimus]|uniref:Ubiquinone biosynthesis monooxygenase UbiB n=1 Tax=Vibrio maritimus TaxID=990268 RepID=A0A090S766_9VIBR|nr:ubiquinone biosynthesis monooxygenase UbiB [Vibrio maritimus]